MSSTVKHDTSKETSGPVFIGLVIQATTRQKI